jgi:hypothetical protein
MVRDFRKRAGMPIERWIEELRRLGESLHTMKDGATLEDVPHLAALAAYYGYTGGLARGYIKDPVQRDIQLTVIRGWQSEVEGLQARLQAPRTG